jgi:hypothetical protein
MAIRSNEQEAMAIIELRGDPENYGVAVAVISDAERASHV